MDRLHAEVIAIGDEITSGQTLDTNSQWLSHGWRSWESACCITPPSAMRCSPTSRSFSGPSSADFVVATGGLGPTADDLTREAFAAAMGNRSFSTLKALEQIRLLPQAEAAHASAERGVPGMLPRGSHRIDNPHGTAPGIARGDGRPSERSCWFFALPGVPAEMKEMWHASVAGRLRQAARAGTSCSAETSSVLGPAKARSRRCCPT